MRPESLTTLVADLDLLSGLRLSHSAAIDVSPAIYRPLDRRPPRVAFRGRRYLRRGVDAESY